MKKKRKEFSHVGKNIIKYTVIMNERNSLMDRFQMNRSGVRPYNYTCGMNNTSFPRNDRSSSDMQNCSRQNSSCMNNQKDQKEGRSCKMPGIKPSQEMYSHLKHLVPAMAYVPCQEFAPTFELQKALQVGTIFPELCKPFCGRRGGRR